MSGMEIVKNPFLRPTLKLDDQKFEFVFLLDCSGSMAGSNVELAKTAVTLFLHSLPADCYFNVIQFNSSFSPFSPQSVKYSEETLQEAKNWVSGIYGAGGTDIYSPMQHVYQQRQQPGYLTQIFSVTDGEVCNPDSVLQLVSSKIKHSRCFALGIGSGADRNLVMGIAKNGGGTYEFVSAGEVIESKILKQLRYALMPALLKPLRILNGHY